MILNFKKTYNEYTLLEMMISLLITSLFVTMYYGDYRTFTGVLKKDQHMLNELSDIMLLERDLHRLTDSCMSIMATRVHDAGFLAVVDGADRRCERKTGSLGHRQRVHVGPKGHHRTRLSALKYADHTGVRDAGTHLQTKACQMAGHQVSRSGLPVAEFRVRMNIPTPGDQSRLDGRDGRIDIGTGYRCLRAGARDHQPQHRRKHSPYLRSRGPAARSDAHT